MNAGPDFLAVAGMIVGGLLCLAMTVGAIGLVVWLSTRNKEEH